MTATSSVGTHVGRSLILGVLLLVGGLSAFFSGLGGRPLGWLWTPLVLAVGAVVVSGLLWRNRSRRGVAVTLAVLGAVLVGIFVRLQSPAGPASLGRALDRLALPEGAELVAEHTRRGNVLCFDVCPQVERVYRVPGRREEVAAHLRGELRAAGYRLRDEPARLFSTASRNRPLDIRVSIKGPEQHAELRSGTRPEVLVQLTAVGNLG